MKSFSKLFIVSLIFYALLLVIVFSNWFSLNPLTGGDWEFYFPETISEFPIVPSSWSIWFGSGFGVNLTFFMNIHSYFMSTTSVLHSYLSLPWVMIERLFWFWPYLIIATIAPFYLFRLIFPTTHRSYALIGSCVYVLNTYSLMLVGGGQMGVALSYAFAPLTFSLLLRLLSSLENDKVAIRKSLIFSFVFAFQLMLDIRIAYVTLVVLVLYVLWYLALSSKVFSFKKFSRLIAFAVFFPATLTILLHLWWILPFFFSTKNPLSTLSVAYIDSESVRFFSFSSFSHALSLLQPNWPENIFGKTSFLKAEFLALPLLAFASLFFLRKNKLWEARNILFFICVALVGVFLAKGSNPPLGEIYISLFNFFPGFYMFRDPTKWYVIIALSYSILIPYSVSQIYTWLQSKKKFSKSYKIFSLQNLFLVTLVLHLLFLIHPALSGQLKGTFEGKEVPNEYKAYKDYMKQDKSYARVLWFPQKNRFSFYNSFHPNVDAKDFFETSKPKDLLSKLTDANVINLLKNSSIGYIAVPSDPYQEIFLDDRKYSATLRNTYDLALSNNPSLKPVAEYGELKIYRLPDKSDLFQAENHVSWTMGSMTEYNIESAGGFSSLIFTSNYDPDWTLRYDNKVAGSEVHLGKFNSFNLAEMTRSARLVYSAQRWVGVGLVISTIAFACGLVGIFLLGRRLR